MLHLACQHSWKIYSPASEVSHCYYYHLHHRPELFFKLEIAPQHSERKAVKANFSPLRRRRQHMHATIPKSECGDTKIMDGPTEPDIIVERHCIIGPAGGPSCSYMLRRGLCETYEWLNFFMLNREVVPRHVRTAACHGPTMALPSGCANRRRQGPRR